MHEVFSSGMGVVLIEWADRVIRDLPDDFLMIELTHRGPNSRDADVTSRGIKYRSITDRLASSREFLLSLD